MGLPISPGAVFGVFKELGKSEDRRPLLVAGLLADELTRELAAGGDLGAVRVGGSTDGGVVALLLVIGDTVTEEDERILKRAHRARVPAIATQSVSGGPISAPVNTTTAPMRSGRWSAYSSAR